MNRMYSDKEILVVDREEVVARVMSLLAEGTWLKEEVEKVDKEDINERMERSTPVEKD